MKFFKSGKYDPNALDKPAKVNFLRFIDKGIFGSLNQFMDIIDTNSPNILEKFVTNMIRIASKHINYALEDHSQHTDPLLEKMSYLNQYPQLASVITNLLLGILDSPARDLWDNPVETTTRRSYHLFLIPDYIALEALIATIGRVMAITIHKKYITDYHFLRHSDSPDFVNLKTMYEKRRHNPDVSNPWIRIQGMISESKYVLQNVNCLYVESLSDFPDSEIKYQVCCYGDFEGAKGHYNKSTVLTMEHTIAQGDPYCSKVFHDTRGDWNLRHPSKEFWDTIEENL